MNYESGNTIEEAFVAWTEADDPTRMEHARLVAHATPVEWCTKCDAPMPDAKGLWPGKHAEGHPTERLSYAGVVGRQRDRNDVPFTVSSSHSRMRQMSNLTERSPDYFVDQALLIILPDDLQALVDGVEYNNTHVRLPMKAAYSLCHIDIPNTVARDAAMRQLASTLIDADGTVTWSSDDHSVPFRKARDAVAAYYRHNGAVSFSWADTTELPLEPDRNIAHYYDMAEADPDEHAVRAERDTAEMLDETFRGPSSGFVTERETETETETESTPTTDGGNGDADTRAAPSFDTADGETTPTLELGDTVYVLTYSGRYHEDGFELGDVYADRAAAERAADTHECARYEWANVAITERLIGGDN